MKKTFHFSRFLLTFVFLMTLGFSLDSCVSYDLKAEGSMNTLSRMNGAALYMDQGIDRYVFLGIRNDSPSEIRVRVRPIGGEIGYSAYSRSSSFRNNFADSKIRAAYLTGGNDCTVQPTEETVIAIFLKNWYLANKNFKNRMEIIVDNGVERHALTLYVTQDDIFDDAEKTFLDNRLGKNDPARNSFVHLSTGIVPGNYSLTIPRD